MPKINTIAVVRRVCGVAALALSLSSFTVQAASISVDGNLADIIGAVGTTNATNIGYGDDPLGSADSPATESNNGFDIDKVYAYFNVATDTLYLGMSVYGTVGDSQPTGSVAANEGVATAGTGSNSRTVFDANETYGIQLYKGISTSDPQLLLYSVRGTNANTPGDTVLVGNNPYALTISQVVSESFNGVEFSIYGLLASGALPAGIANQDLLVRFTAGSGDTNSTSSLAEDSHNLQMQVVPVPAAAWLFGSGLMGLIAIARRRRKLA